MASTYNIIPTEAYAISVTPGAKTEWDIKFFAPATFPPSGFSNLYFIVITNGNLSQVPSTYDGVLINGTAATSTTTSPSVDISKYTAPISNPSVLTITPGKGTTYNLSGFNDLILTGAINSNSSLDLIEILTVATPPSGTPTILGYSGVNIYLVKPEVPPFPILPVPDVADRLIPYLKQLEKQVRCLEKKVCKLHC